MTRTGFRSQVTLAAALALLVQPVADVQAQGTPGAAEADKAQKSRAMICASNYAASASVADSASMAVMLERQKDLQRRFGLDHRAIYDLARGAMTDRNPDLLEFEASTLAACDHGFCFTPVITLSGGKLLIPQGTNQTAARQTTPRFSDLACGSIFWVAALAWPQEREGWLRYANGAIDKHIAATPNDTRPQAEERVMTDGQARARLLQQGGAEPEKFKNDHAVCAAQFSIKPNAPTPAAAPAPAPAPPPVPAKGLAESAGGGLRVASASENGIFMIAGPAPLQGPLGPIQAWTWFFPRAVQNDGVQDYDAMAIQMEIRCSGGTIRPLYYEPYLAGKPGKGGASDEQATNVQPGSSQFNLWQSACDPLYISGLESLAGNERLPDHRAGRAAADSWLRIVYGDKQARMSSLPPPPEQVMSASPQLIYLAPPQALAAWCRQAS